MPTRIQLKFLSTALNSELLLSPFQFETGWHVLTGAPCSGKTTLVDLLTARGFMTVPEIARQAYDREIAKGRTIAEIHQDIRNFQRGVADLQLSCEQDLDPDDTAFLDRAFPDSLTFFRIFGLNPNEILPKCFQYHYDSVFILDRLPFERDRQLGPEDDASARFVDEWLERDYRALNYQVVRVPVLPPEERLAFLLERIAKKGDSW